MQFSKIIGKENKGNGNSLSLSCVITMQDSGRLVTITYSITAWTYKSADQVTVLIPYLETGSSCVTMEARSTEIDNIG